MTTSFKAYGLQCGEGWQALYVPLIERCRAEGVTVTQLKEKLGRMRLYTGPGASKELMEAILAAELLSAEICEVCGDVGDCSNRKGFIMTRCQAHRDTPATVGRLPLIYEH